MIKLLDILKEQSLGLKTVKIYEVYVETDDMEGTYAFESKESFNSSLGDFIRDDADFIISHEGYANVNLSDKELSEIKKVGFIFYR
jgi:hypothetical protein